jgi:hypothetical protein
MILNFTSLGHVALQAIKPKIKLKTPLTWPFLWLLHLNSIIAPNHNLSYHYNFQGIQIWGLSRFASFWSKRKYTILKNNRKIVLPSWKQVENVVAFSRIRKLGSLFFEVLKYLWIKSNLIYHLECGSKIRT